MNQSKRWSWLLLVAALVFLVVPVSGFAAEDTPGHFGLKANLPENQSDKSISYFDLLVTPKQQQTIEVTLTNTAAEKRTFEVTANPAMTSDGGAIDYGPTTSELDKTVPFDFRKVVTLDKTEYEVAGNTSIQIPVHIAMPDLTFNGRVLGGIYVTPKDGEQTASSSEGVQIKNKIAYSLAIVLQQNKDAIKPDLKLLDGTVTQVNAYPNVQLHFQNPTPTIISDLTFTTKIYYGDKLFIENTSNPYLVAPNTNFHLNLPIKDQEAQSGKYRAEIVAKSGDEYEWKFDYDFTVTNKKAEDANKNSVYALQHNDTDWTKIILLIALAVALLFVIILLWKRRKDKEEKKESPVA